MIQTASAQQYPVSSPFLPTNITGIALWLDAADASTVTGTTNVTKINDKSGNGVNLSNATGYSYPNNTFNGTYPSFFCPNGYAQGSAATLGYNAAFALTMPFSLFFVGIQTNLSTYGDLCDSAPASGGANRIYVLTSGYSFQSRIGSGLPASTSNFVVNFMYAAGTSASATFLNGSSYVTGTVPQFTCSGITVANRYTLNESFPGHICEVVAFNIGLTVAQRQQMEGYLAWKWGLQGSLPAGHPYKSAAPTGSSGRFSVKKGNPPTVFPVSVQLRADIKNGKNPVIYTTNLVENLDASTYTSGSTWTALVGNNYAITGTFTKTSTPGGSTAIVLDGSSYAQDQTGIAASTLYLYTLDLWFYSAAGQSASIVGEGGQANLGGWNVTVISVESNTVSVGFWIGGVYRLSVGSYTANTWTHVAYSYNNTTGAVVGYFNGQRVATGSATKQWPSTVFYTTGGGMNPFGSFTGRIGAFKVYTTVLTDSQVNQNYNALKSRFGL